MSDNNKARIEAELAGTQQVANEGAKIVGTIKGIGEASNKAGEVSKNALGGAFKSVAGVLGGLASEAARAVNVLGAINLAAAVEDTKRLDLATAKLGQSAGISGTQLKASFDAIESKTLESSLAMTDFAKSLGRVTYDSKFAVESVSAFGDEALASGRSLADYGQLGVVFQHLGIQSKDVTQSLGEISDIAQKLGTVGGPNALKDSLAALGGVLPGVSAHTKEAQLRLVALVAELGKGKTAEQQTQIAGQALGFVQGNRRKLEFALGRNVINDQGEVDDPLGVIRDYKKIIDQRFGKGKNADKIKRNAVLETFGPALGSSLLRFDAEKAEDAAATAKDNGLAAVEAEKVRNSAPGKRIAAQLEKDQGLRTAGDKLLGVHDSLVNNLGVAPTLLLESGGLNLAGKGVSALGTRLAPSIATAAGTGALGAIAGVSASFAAPAIGVLSEIGEDTETTGAKYRSQHSGLLGAEIANAAIQKGDLTPVIGRAHGDPEIIAAALARLASSLDQLPENLAAQVQAGLKASNVIVKIPLDPNAPKAN